jgi:DNA-binding NarL/FixJ family response regulator
MNTIIIADDHSFTLNGTKNFVESKKLRVLNTFNNGITAYNYIKIHEPNIAILDVNMPGYDGLEVLQKIHDQKINTKVILLTMHKEKSIYNRAIQLGAFGYILKEQAEIELEKCLIAIQNNQKYYNIDLDNELTFDTAVLNSQTKDLSVAEKKILELVSQNKPSEEIANLLFISKRTVEGHRRNIIEKLGLPKEKYALLIWAIQNKT